jgi:hypothetical protein
VGVKEQLRGDAWVHLDFDSIYLIKSDGTGLTRLTNGFDAGSRDDLQKRCDDAVVVSNACADHAVLAREPRASPY